MTNESLGTTVGTTTHTTSRLVVMRATTPSAIPPPAPPLRVRSEDDQKLEFLGRQERLHARHKSSVGLHVAKSAEWWGNNPSPNCPVFAAGAVSRVWQS